MVRNTTLIKVALRYLWNFTKTSEGFQSQVKINEIYSSSFEENWWKPEYDWINASKTNVSFI